MGCVLVGWMGRWVVSEQVGWVEGLCQGRSGGSMGCVRVGCVGR